MSVDAFAGRSTAVVLLPSAARTSSANGTGVDISDYEGMAEVVLNSGAGTGTTPTLDVKIQDSDDNSAFADVTGAVFAQVTNAAASLQKLVLNTDKCRKYIRAVATIGGTTPSFACGVEFMSVKKYT